MVLEVGYCLSAGFPNQTGLWLGIGKRGRVPVAGKCTHATGSNGIPRGSGAHLFKEMHSYFTKHSLGQMVGAKASPINDSCDGAPPYWLRKVSGLGAAQCVARHYSVHNVRSTRLA